ncbi:hypothetical protein KW803_02025 [Candidatus Saccharibacteria bacterium]|nr:hypothetical protein [Candidatus Saccharibacteria bacterium]
MAIDETFRPRIYFDEQEVFEDIGRATRLRQLQPTNFEGPVAEWAEERTKLFGDVVISRMVFVEPGKKEDHRVAWVYRSGIDLETEETFARHHIACDCSLEADRDDELERIFQCQHLMGVLNKRAWQISATYGAEDILRTIPDLPEEALLGYEHGHEIFGREFSLRALSSILDHDFRHPDSWVANVIDGEHQASLMALIFQQDPAEIHQVAEILERGGVVEIDGDTIMLTEEEKQKIRDDIAYRRFTEEFGE